MSYAKIDTRAARDLKLSGISGDAYRVWVQGLLFVQDAKTDGYLPEGVIPALGLPIPQPEWVGELVASGLWKNARGGYEIHDYLQWNDPASVRNEKRDAAKRRMERFRKREKASRTIDTRAVRGELPEAETGPIFGGDFDTELDAKPEVPARDNAIEIPGKQPAVSRPAPVPGQTMRGHRSALGSPVMDYERLKSQNGYVGVRFRVPMTFHQELVGRYGGDEQKAEDALAKFYRKLDDELPADASIPNIYQFINPHFAVLVNGRAAAVPAVPGVARRADDQRAPVDASMRDQLTQAANRKTP